MLQHSSFIVLAVSSHPEIGASIVARTIRHQREDRETRGTREGGGARSRKGTHAFSKKSFNRLGVTSMPASRIAAYNRSRLYSKSSIMDAFAQNIAMRP